MTALHGGPGHRPRAGPQARGVYACRMRRPFPYAARARSAEEARRAVKESSAKWRLDRSERSKQTWLASVERFHAAVEAAYPANFWTDLEKLRAGDASVLETAIEFLEADPMFFRSGYVKSELLVVLKRLALNSRQIERLRAVVIHVVLDRDRREFRRYCRFAHYIDGPDFRNQLEAIVFPVDPDAERRARWVLAALRHAETSSVNTTIR